MGVWTAAGKGIRYKEHPVRKHGRRPDRYWCVQYKLHGRNINEAVGWWSDGVTQSQCEALLSELRVNQKSGQGPQTLREMRTANKERREAEAAAREAARQKNRSLGGFFELEYLPRARLSQAGTTIRMKKGVMNRWLAPLAGKPLAGITPFDLESQVLRPMLQAGKSPATARYALALFSTVWNTALEMGLVSGENPAARIKKPKIDNQRDRFLRRDEAAALLEFLRERSIDGHDMALLSLFSGMRAGECRALAWLDIDFESGLIFVKDTKNKRNRHAHLTAEIREMLTRRSQGQSKAGLVFGKRRHQHQEAMAHFREAVKSLGLNDGVTDRRQKVVFHSLRHTFASWLVQMGTPLYTVSKLMGHSSIKMTERYAHLAPDSQKAAVMVLEGALTAA